MRQLGISTQAVIIHLCDRHNQPDGTYAQRCEFLNRVSVASAAGRLRLPAAARLAHPPW
jgi:hypothetical protein